MFNDVEGTCISFKNVKRPVATKTIEIQTDDYEIEISETYAQTNEMINGSTQTNVKDILAITDDFTSKNITLDESKLKKLNSFLGIVII